MVASDQTPKSFIARKPLLSYFVLSYALFWLALILFIVIVTASGLKMDSLPSWAMPLIQITGSWMPTVAALIVTGITEGRGGIKKLLLKFTHFKLPARWYFAALIPFGLAFAAAGIYRLAGGAVSGGVSLSVNFWVSLIAINFFTGATGEESGWRGFALPRLLEKYSPLKAGILLGLAWNFWHLPLWFTSGFSSLDLLEYILFFSIAIISLAVLMTWILCKTSNSLIPMVITHFSFNLGFDLIGPQGLGIGPYIPLIGILAALLLVTAVGVSSTGSLSMKVKNKFNPGGISQ
jgi:membrane protease YdiL (CAAX protease family)